MASAAVCCAVCKTPDCGTLVSMPPAARTSRKKRLVSPRRVSASVRRTSPARRRFGVGQAERDGALERDLGVAIGAGVEVDEAEQVVELGFAGRELDGGAERARGGDEIAGAPQGVAEVVLELGAIGGERALGGGDVERAR